MYSNILSWARTQLNKLPSNYTQESKESILKANESLKINLQSQSTTIDSSNTSHWLKKLKPAASLNLNNTNNKLNDLHSFIKTSNQRRKSYLKPKADKAKDHYDASEILRKIRQKAVIQYDLLNNSSPMNQIKCHEREYMNFRHYMRFKRKLRSQQASAERSINKRTMSYYKPDETSFFRKQERAKEESRAKIAMQALSFTKQSQIKTPVVNTPKRNKSTKIIEFDFNKRNILFRKSNKKNFYYNSHRNPSNIKCLEKKIASYENLLSNANMRPEKALKLSRKISDGYISVIRNKINRLNRFI